jgi:hypothetical protein
MKVSMALTSAIAFIAAASCAHNPGPIESANHAEERSSWLDDDDDKTPGRACTTESTELASADGRITPFRGPIITYPPDSSTAPTVTTTQGPLHVSVNVPVKPEAQYVGVILPFPKCTDASTFTGVRFKIRGNYHGCSLEYATRDPQHEDRTGRAPFATGKHGAYPPQARLENTQVTPTAQTVTIPFNENNLRGNPPLPLDSSKVTGVLWQLSVGMASNMDDGTTACVAELDIDDVSFYR